ncbi:MAG TPA: glycosyltransferase [Steroidobacteraceae bacterium]|nr:glycosyltransferase [Steroidobacteraceae bacterium]
MTARQRIAFFNPIFAHYRTALLRELRASERCEYFLFGDTRDLYGNVPVCDLSADPHFRLTPYRRFLKVFAWQWGSVGPALWGNFDAYILEGDAYYLSSWVGAILAKLRRRRVLFWSHGWTRHDTGLKHWVRALFYHLADGLLLYGERARSIGIECGFAPERLHVMYNSLDFDDQCRRSAEVSADEIHSLRRDLFGPEPVPVVIGTARLTERKRFDLLIRALGLINRSGRRVDLLLVGDGPARASLETLARSERVKVVFAGACYDEPGLARYFACASVTVMPGEVGLTCMHSLGYGVPVVTHGDPARQMPEFEAIVPGETGDLFAPDDVMDLATKLDRWTRLPGVEPAVRTACLARIETRYNARAQARAIELALSGVPASP